MPHDPPPPQHWTALSIVAPHGRNIAEGRKTLEVRSWQPPQWPLRDLLIVENTRYLREDGQTDPDGRAVALVDVVKVEPWRPDQVEAACSSGWVPGYFAWHLERVRVVVVDCASPVLAARGLYGVVVNL